MRGSRVRPTCRGGTATAGAAHWKPFEGLSRSRAAPMALGAPCAEHLGDYSDAAREPSVAPLRRRQREPREELLELAASGCAADAQIARRADALIAQRKPLPSWCVDEVLLSPDLLPHVVEWLRWWDGHRRIHRRNMHTPSRWSKPAVHSWGSQVARLPCPSSTRYPHTTKHGQIQPSRRRRGTTASRNSIGLRLRLRTPKGR